MIPDYTPPITQSLIKAFTDYLDGKECGKRIEAFYYLGIKSEPSEAMNVGAFFEYKAFGTLPKSGIAPVPKWKKGETELQKKYAIAAEQAQNIRKAIEHYGLKIVSTGKKIQCILDDGTVIEGTLDLEFISTIPVPCYNNDTGSIDRIIPADTLITGDAKTSGLMGDRGKWAELGWHPDFLDQKERIMIQALHYSFIQRKNHNKDVPFFFLVYSQTNTVGSLIVDTQIDEDKYLLHEETCKTTRKMIDAEYVSGWKANPEVERCANCELQHKCKDKITVPKIISIYY